jgi:RNAse (barnase) inhibitor barstar
MPPFPALPRAFLFVESPAEYRDDASLVIRLPRGIRSKKKLFAILAHKLHFPRYFGRNWDALEECLRDLSWLPEEQPIAIVHEDMPFGPRSDNRQTYVNILCRAAESAPARGRVLSIILPAALRGHFSPSANGPR